MNSTLQEMAPAERVRAAKREKVLRKTKSEFGAFFHLTRPKRNYYYGPHTRTLIAKLQETSEKLVAGKCVYLCVCMPPRHGKSDVVSRRWPVWHLGTKDPNAEFILCSYNFSLAASMSYDLRNCAKEMLPLYGITLERDRKALDSWRLAEHDGAVHATGLGGTITGRGAHILAVDDYFKNREEAESINIRNKCWDSFESDLLTRLAPTHAVVIVANRWHEDDIVGRIKHKNDPEHPNYDPDFPIFETLEFPAQNEETGEFLSKRFSPEWYRSWKALMGSYAWQCQAQQQPIARHGNFWNTKEIAYHEKLSDFPDISYIRVWDLASTEKEKIKDDPDYTMGGLIGLTFTDEGLPVLWIKDFLYCREEATKRNALIMGAAKNDGMGVKIYLEAVAGYKDTYTLMRDILKGKRSVQKITVSTDKIVRADPVTPIFEAGNVHVFRAPWNPLVIGQCGSFPSGDHDDAVDVISAALKRLAHGKMQFMERQGF